MFFSGVAVAVTSVDEEAVNVAVVAEVVGIFVVYAGTEFQLLRLVLQQLCVKLKLLQIAAVAAVVVTVFAETGVADFIVAAGATVVVAAFFAHIKFAFELEMRLFVVGPAQ